MFRFFIKWDARGTSFLGMVGYIPNPPGEALPLASKDKYVLRFLVILSCFFFSQKMGPPLSPGPVFGVPGHFLAF